MLLVTHLIPMLCPRLWTKVLAVSKILFPFPVMLICVPSVLQALSLMETSFITKSLPLCVLTLLMPLVCMFLFRDICEAYQGIELQLDAVYEHLNSMNSTNSQLPIWYLEKPHFLCWPHRPYFWLQGPLFGLVWALLAIFALIWPCLILFLLPIALSSNVSWFVSWCILYHQMFKY